MTGDFGSPPLLCEGMMPTEPLTNGYFDMMRRNHPIRVGEVVDGKKVVCAFWEWTYEHGDRPMYQLEGESDSRVWYA